MAKLDLAKYAVARAKVGDPYPLIGRMLNALEGRVRLSPEEILLVRDALEATAGKEAGLRDLEKRLIAHQVDGMIDNAGYGSKDAVAEVKRRRGRSVRTIRTAISKYGKQRRHRD